MATRKSAAALVAASIFAYPAHAELPAPVRDMIQSAFDGQDEAEIDAVIAVAKRTNPEDEAEIDAMRAAYDTRAAERAEAAEEQRVAELRERSLLEGWSGQGEVGFSRSTGNTSDTNLAVGIGLTREGIRWEHALRARADFARSNGVTTREQYLAALESRYKFNERLFAFGLAQYEQDRFQGYDARYTLSGGLGYRVIDEDNMRLDVQAGPAWRRTEFTAGGSDSSLAGLASADFRWDISDSATFGQRFNGLFESGNSTLSSETWIETQISGALSARLSYLVEHETDPPAGNVKTDTLTRATLVYGF